MIQESVLRIRRLSAEDADLLKAVRVEATQESPASVYPTSDEEMDKPLDEFKKQLIWDSNNFVFGAFGDAQLVAIAGLKRERGLKLQHTAIIWGVYVKPPFRGRGVAKQLVATVLDAARGIPDVCQVKLRVHTQNEAAKRVYISNGFESCGIDRNVLRIGDASIDEELMILVFNPSTAKRTGADTAQRASQSEICSRTEWLGEVGNAS
jgi:RimJ/RimL family protein N-acetyltransferase